MKTVAFNVNSIYPYPEYVLDEFRRYDDMTEEDLADHITFLICLLAERTGFHVFNTEVTE